MQEGMSATSKTKNLRSALFFSSLRSARFEVEDYDLRVRIIQSEKDMPLLTFGPGGPHLRDAFTITLVRKGRAAFEDTHRDIEGVERSFLNCKIDIECGWLPIEDEEVTK